MLSSWQSTATSEGLNLRQSCRRASASSGLPRRSSSTAAFSRMSAVRSASSPMAAASASSSCATICQLPTVANSRRAAWMLGMYLGASR